MRPVARRRLRRKLLLPLLVSAILALTVAALTFAISYLAWPLEEVRVEGARMYPASQLEQEISSNHTLLTVNPEEIERKVESDSWVDSAVVHRDWKSDTVTVEVEEKRAILRAEVDGEEKYFSMGGDVLQGGGGRSLQPVSLRRGQLEEVFEGVDLLHDNGVEVESVSEVGPGGVRLDIEGGSVIFSGRVGTGQIEVLKGLIQSHPENTVFDLRSPERVVVGG